MMENQEMDVFSDLDVPVDLDVEALTELAQSRKTLQTFWETNPEICLEMLSEEKKISEIPVDVKKTNISQHIRTQQHTPKQSWLGIAGSLCVFIAIASLFWNFIPSSRNVEAISQVAGKSLPIVETKYATKNIEDIQEGDEVLAYDVRTGKTVKNKVSATFHLKSDHLRYLTVLDANGSEQTFQTTDTHPFWVNSDRPDLFRKARDSVSEYDVTTESEILIDHDNLFVTEDGYYVEAKYLKEGDQFIGPSGETSILVKTLREEHPEGFDVYNFKVADNSNYFVIANYADFQNGAEPVLVHNGNCSGSNNGIKVYNSIKESPAYPSKFIVIKGRTTYHNVNESVISTLHELKPGKWRKVYKDGMVGNQQVSIHYFEHLKSKVVAMVKVKEKWSNP